MYIYSSKKNYAQANDDKAFFSSILKIQYKQKYF